MRIAKIEQTIKKKLVNGTLPDIDTDFPTKDRGFIKKYIEDRYGKEQVCSVGTYSTMQVKGIVKDLARVSSVDYTEANLITAIVDKDDKSFKDLIVRAQSEPRLKAFIKRNSDIFYMMPTIMNQPKGKSIHACAMIVFPDVMRASEWTPTRMQKGMLVSEWDGGQMEDSGFLKDDILGLKQLDKFMDILDLIEKNGKERPDIYNLPHDSEVYRYFGNGWNGDVFQFSSSGLSSYIRSMKPQNMADLTVAVALYRPGPMGSGYHEKYVKCKNEGAVAEYLWGTESITKETFGLLVYQEQIMKMCVEIGGLSLREADDVRSAMGKKKVAILKEWEPVIKEGFLKRGATEEQFQEVWETTLNFAEYCFNKSHSVAYAITGYIGQYLKVNYPIEYWTVALEYGNEEKTLEYISEILQAKEIKIKSPDMNKSLIHMFSEQETSTIFWGLGSIKGIGEDTALQIIKEREANGEYKSFSDFYHRCVFKGSKVNKTTIEALIACGAFDILYGFEDNVCKRNSLIRRFRIFKKVKIKDTNKDPYSSNDIYERWWWNLQQKKLTGLSFIDYKEIAEEMEIETKFLTPLEFSKKQDRGIFRAFGGYISEIKVGRSVKGQYARLTVEHNYKLIKVLVWSEEYAQFKDQLKQGEKKLVIFTGNIKYDPKWSKANQFTLSSESMLKVL